MQDKVMKPDRVSYFQHEGELIRMERINHRLFVVIVVLIIALIFSNSLWLLRLLGVLQ